MKTIHDISAILGQTKSVVTINLTIYSKAKQIQWRHPDEFKHLVIRMGGFHIALHFLSVIGKKFEESGIADLLMESGLYGTTSTKALLKGKSYNRGLRVHKLIMEALLRLQWKAFCRWLENANTDTQQLEAVRVDQVQTNLIKCKAAISEGQVKNVFDGLCDFTENLHSQLFKFWNSYIKMEHPVPIAFDERVNRVEDANQNNSEEDQRDAEFDESSDEDVEDHSWKELLIQGEIGSSATFLLAGKTRFGRVVRFNNRLLY